VSESAVNAKRGWGSFGVKPAQSETPVRAAAKRRPRGRGRSERDAQLPIKFHSRLRQVLWVGVKPQSTQHEARGGRRDFRPCPLSRHQNCKTPT